MNEIEIINLLKDYHDYYNLDYVEVKVVGNKWQIEGYRNRKVIIEKIGEFNND